MNEKNIESKNVVKINGDDNLSSSDKYTIILKLYKGLQDNLETLEKKVNSKKSKTEVSQLAYKVDKIASGLQCTLDFENEKTKKISENFRELYRHIRFSMKMIYENEDFKLLESSRNIANTLYNSWAKIKPII